MKTWIISRMGFEPRTFACLSLQMCLNRLRLFAGESSPLLRERPEYAAASKEPKADVAHSSRDEETILSCHVVAEARDDVTEEKEGCDVTKSPGSTPTKVSLRSGSSRGSDSDVTGHVGGEGIEMRKINGANGKTGKSRSKKRVSLDPNHSFHTIIFDCSGWTFIDLMGMETVRQVGGAKERWLLVFVEIRASVDFSFFSCDVR